MQSEYLIEGFLMYEVSIIITAYNADKYISSSINSIINQTFKKWILIAVDDGSSDRTFEILNSFKSSLKNQLILIKNEKNLGINISLNKALEKVETPFFTRQDADDLSLPNRIEILVNSLKQNTKYQFVSSKMRSIDDKNLVFPINLTKYPKKSDFIVSLPYCNAPTLFRSSILKKVRFNPSKIYKKRFEDYEFFFQCISNNFIGYNVNDITYLVRQDLNYYSKIVPSERIVEAYLKFKIFKKFRIRLKNISHIFIPLIKIFIPVKIYKILLKNYYK